MRRFAHLVDLLLAVLVIGFLALAQHIGKGHLGSLVLLGGWVSGMAGTAAFLSFRDRVARP